MSTYKAIVVFFLFLIKIFGQVYVAHKQKQLSS